MALSGSKNRPPSENESGVTLSTPITMGRPRDNRRSSKSAWVPAWARSSEGAAVERRGSVMASLCAAQRDGVKRSARRRSGLAIGDLQRQLLGVLDPACHEAYG